MDNRDEVKAFLSSRRARITPEQAGTTSYMHRTGVKDFHHPVVGDLHLSYEVLEMPADPGLSLVAFCAEAGSTDDDALRLLASWAATHDPTDALATHSQGPVLP